MSCELAWIKSSYSGGAGGNCVEVAARPRTVAIRDSKHPEGHGIAVPATAWAHFVGFAAGAASAG
nr:DUF397 domain-containing protein [Streptomyces rectiverticillatus]